MAKGFEVEGRIELINEVQQFPSGFTKREFVVEVQDGQYPQMIKFECIKDRTSLTDGFQTGDEVKVSFDIRGNEHKGRYFVNLNAWKLEKLGGSSAGAGGVPTQSSEEDGPPSHLSEPPADLDLEGGDEIPF